MDPSRRQILLPLNHLLISFLLLSFFLLHCSSATAVAAGAASSTVESQARVLLHWKSTLQNSHAQQLGSWSLSNNACMWHGITCMENGSRAVITGISLSRAGLVDFGTAKIIKSDLSNWSTLAGTFGYAAPELSYMTRANEKCDVYSFGIVILEVIMGRHPSDLVSSLSSSNIQQMLFNDVLDQRISPPATYIVKEVLLLAIIAFSCIRIIPQARPTMQRISHLFISGNIPTIHEPFNSIKLCQLVEFLT